MGEGTIPRPPDDWDPLTRGPRILTERAVGEKYQECSVAIAQPVYGVTESAGGGFMQRHETGAIYWLQDAGA